ncbi:MAG: hypothetical protein IKB13_04495 [Clostridia bacterium]|nr:hypothetical protein [Clostridia bacterium]
MNFIYRLQESYNRFMYGRYGGDTLNHFLSFVYLFLVFLGFIFRILVFLTKSVVLYKIRYALYIISLIIFAVTVFRSLSKNLTRRARENEAFMRLWGNWQPYLHKQAKNAEPKVRMFVRKMQDRDHIYKKCPDCKAVLRLAKKKGKHKTRCPACGKLFEVRVLFGEK